MAYVDKSSGKTYYSDGTTTTWDKPDDFEEVDASPSKLSKKKVRTDSSSDLDSEMPKKKKKKKDRKSKGDVDAIPIYNNKAEAVAAFKGLLLAKDISPTTKWNDVVKACSGDGRWEACATVGERKQALAEYQTKRANELRETRRKEMMRAKDAFGKLLTDVLPTVRGFSSTSSRFSDIRDALSKDDRFYVLEEEHTREELFYDFVEELRKREERNKRSKKRDAKDAFIKFLKDREETGALTFASTW
jgi:pre-mRNA-processing factor 40